eukprot:scaffold1733_cov123-Isochrysis_galbana.AAC.8
MEVGIESHFHQGSGIIVWGLKQPLVNDVMSDSPTDTALTKGRERSAPGMSHADTHTPLHDPTGGVPSHKALSDRFSLRLRRQATRTPELGAP